MTAMSATTATTTSFPPAPPTSPQRRTPTPDGSQSLPEGVRPLRGSLVLRKPTRLERAHRPPLQLTRRDGEILTAVHQHGFLTAELISLAFFPPAGGCRTAPPSAAHDRLRLLWLWGYLQRIELPRPRRAGGGRPYLYAVGRGAGALVDPYLETELPVRARRLGRLDDRFLDHDLLAARLWASLCAWLGAARVRHWRWIPERELRARHFGVDDPATGKRLPFLPDGCFEIEYGDPVPGVRVGPGFRARPSALEAAPPGERQRCVLEIDTGTLALRRFRRKLRGFELALERELLDREWGSGPFEVLVLTQSEKRLAHLQAAARRVVPRGRWAWYSFATTAALAPDRFGEACWRTLEEEQVGLLYDGAWMEAGVTPTVETKRADYGVRSETTAYVRFRSSRPSDSMNSTR